MFSIQIETWKMDIYFISFFFFTFKFLLNFYIQIHHTMSSFTLIRVSVFIAFMQFFCPFEVTASGLFSPLLVIQFLYFLSIIDIHWFFVGGSLFSQFFVIAFWQATKSILTKYRVSSNSFFFQITYIQHLKPHWDFIPWYLL